MLSLRNNNKIPNRPLRAKVHYRRKLKSFFFSTLTHLSITTSHHGSRRTEGTQSESTIGREEEGRNDAEGKEGYPTQVDAKTARASAEKGMSCGGPPCTGHGDQTGMDSGDLDLCQLASSRLMLIVATLEQDQQLYRKADGTSRQLWKAHHHESLERSRSVSATGVLVPPTYQHTNAQR